MTAERRRYGPGDDRPIHQVRSDGRIVGEIRVDTPVFVISVAADLAGMHAQTLRSYDREGLVSPRRTSGGGRRYSARDIERLQQVQQLSQDEGVNRAGIRRIMELETQVDAMRARLEELAAELDAARAALAADQRHTGGAAASVVAGSVVAGAVVGDAVVPWRGHTTAIVTWQPGR
jgi:MerR family transcriptional regulator/heat shock protein HspR